MTDYTDNDTTKMGALVTATMSSFLTTFMTSSINIALPTIGQDLAMDAILLTWVVTSYLLAAAIFLVPLGRIADIYGQKRIFTYGIVAFTVSSLLLAISNSAVMMIAFRTLQGIGGAMIFGTGMAILTSVFPIEERGKALGINVAAVYLGVSLGPVLGGFFTQHFGWRSIFMASVLLGFVVISFVFWKLKGEWAGARGEKFDFPGSVIYGLALIAIMYGLSLLPAISAALLILGGALALLAFAKWEMRVKSPVFDMSLFKHNTVFTFSNLATLINYSAIYAVAFLLSLYLQYTKGLSPQNAGLILVSQPVVIALISPFVGRLSDRVEPRIVASTGMAFTFAGLLFFAFLSDETTFMYITIGLITLGFGIALFVSPNSNAVMSSVEKRFYGVS
jgi:EmrB/QacA subfamily drug resistance transporter